MLSQLKKEAGEIPSPTCPLIDKCIKEIKNHSEALAYLKKFANRYETPDEVFDDLPELDEGELCDTLESIRTANDQLRHLGDFWYHEYKKLEESIDG